MIIPSKIRVQLKSKKHDLRIFFQLKIILLKINIFVLSALSLKQQELSIMKEEDSQSTQINIKTIDILNEYSDTKINENEASFSFKKYNYTTNSFKSFNMQLGYSNSALNSMPITPNRLLGNFEVINNVFLVINLICKNI